MIKIFPSGPLTTTGMLALTLFIWSTKVCAFWMSPLSLSMIIWGVVVCFGVVFTKAIGSVKSKSSQGSQAPGFQASASAEKARGVESAPIRMKKSAVPIVAVKIGKSLSPNPPEPGLDKLSHEENSAQGKTDHDNHEHYQARRRIKVLRHGVSKVMPVCVVCVRNPS